MMKYKVVFLDIDGTILPHGKSVTNATKQAVRRLKENNIHVVIATGRAPYFAKPVIDDLDVQSMIFFNGSYVYHKGEIIHRKPIEKDVLKKLHIRTSDYRHPLTYLGGTDLRVTELEHPYVKEAFRQDVSGLQEAPPAFWEEESIYQLFLHCEAEEEHGYQQSIPELYFRRWSSPGMRTCDVNCANTTKATGIIKILEQLEVSQEEAVAFGDGLNDVEMLSMVGMGVAMGNAIPEVQAYADMVTITAEEDGVKHGLEKLGLI